MLDTVTAMIPLSGGKVPDAAAARADGHRYLSGWLADVEAKWAAHANKKADEQPRMTLSAQIDHMRKLSGQAISSKTLRVVYTASGTMLSAARLLEDDTVVEHGAY